MRHRVAHRKLGRTTEHRLSLLRNLAMSLITHERIRTTLAKAKELRPFAERLITLGKKDSLHARRRALAVIPGKEAVAKVFDDLSPRFADRPGGYTRILKLGPRIGDGAEMAFIEFVDYVYSAGKEAKAPKETKEDKKDKKEGKEKKERKTAETVESDEEQEEKTAAAKTKKTGKRVTKKTTAQKATLKGAKKTSKKTAKKSPNKKKGT